MHLYLSYSPWSLSWQSHRETAHLDISLFLSLLHLHTHIDIYVEYLLICIHIGWLFKHWSRCAKESPNDQNHLIIFFQKSFSSSFPPHSSWLWSSPCYQCYHFFFSVRKGTFCNWCSHGEMNNKAGLLYLKFFIPSWNEMETKAGRALTASWVVNCLGFNQKCDQILMLRIGTRAESGNSFSCCSKTLKRSSINQYR